MTSHAEDVLYLSLTDTDALESLALIGLAEEAIPTEEMRPVVFWALDRFFESARTRAPTREALLETWGPHIEQAKVELLPEDEDTDTVQWAISNLKSTYIHARYNQFVRTSSSEMATAPVPDRLEVLASKADELFSISSSLQPRHMRSNMLSDYAQVLANYEAREREGFSTRGMLLGLPLVDQHIYGVHEGELAMLAAGPKTGKSFFLGWGALHEWLIGNDVVLYTLENSVEMTRERIACMHHRIDYRLWQRGTCPPPDVEKVRQFINEELPSKSNSLHIIMPEPGKRTVPAMVRECQMLGSRRLYIDQLTHIEPGENPGRKPRHEVIGDILSDLKVLISTGNEPISCLLAHQINRAGVEAARKAGFLLMEHMAESSYAERTVDLALGIHQSADDKVVGEAILQILAARRVQSTAWRMTWRPHMGRVMAESEVEIAA